MFNVNGQNYKLATRYNYTAQSKVLFDRATALGYALPSENTRRQIDTLIRALVSSGIWDKLDDFYQYAYNDLSLSNFSRINWKRPFNMPATVNGGCLYTIQGWEGNGIDGYLALNNTRPDNSNYQFLNGGFGGVMYKEPTISPNSVGRQFICAVYAERLSINLANGTRQRIHTTSNLLTATTNATQIGLKYISMTTTGERNWVSVGNPNQILTASNDVSDIFNIDQAHFANVAFSYYNNSGASCYLQGSALSYAETQTFRSIYNSYLNNIGLTQFA